VYAALYGTPEQVEVNWKIVSSALGRSGKAQILTAEDLGGDPIFSYRADHMRGAMNLQEFGLYNWRGGGGSIFFAPVAQALGSETERQTRMAKEILGKHGMDYVGEYIVGWRDMHHIIDILFDRNNPDETRRAYRCYEELVTVFNEAGYGSYRTNTAFMDKVADGYGPVARTVNRRLKAALDPNGILAPGKSGIRL
jgi:4-cresol dehydrogenase (hydroxylating)